MATESENFYKAFIEAIKQVPNRYYNLGERTYAYELYFHLRTVLEKNNYSGEALLTGEIVKTDTEAKEVWPIGLPEAKIAGSKRTQPDLTYHNPKSTENQIAIVEIKTTDTTDLYRDFCKLSDYKNHFNFKLAIFLLVNHDTSVIKFDEVQFNNISDEVHIITVEEKKLIQQTTVLALKQSLFK